MTQIRVVVDGVAPILIKVEKGWFLQVDSEVNYFKVTAYEISTVFGFNWKTSKQVIAGFPLAKLVLWEGLSS